MNTSSFHQATALKRGAAAAVALTLALALGACSGEDSAANGAADPITSVTIGIIPISDYAPVTYAIEEGYFAEEGLEVAVQPLQGGAAAVPGLLSGDVQISVTNWVSFVQAVDKGIPIQAFAPGAVATPGWSGVYAASSSDITDPESLLGRTVAVPELTTITDLTTRVALAEAGLDPEDVVFTAIPLPTIPPAISDGTVDSGWLVEPFISMAKASGSQQVLDVYGGTLNGASIGGYITTEEWAADNPEALGKFVKALTRATDELNADTELIEQTLINAGTMQEAQRGALMLPTYGETLTTADIERWLDLMVEYGFIDEAVDLSEAVHNVS